MFFEIIIIIFLLVLCSRRVGPIIQERDHGQMTPQSTCNREATLVKLPPYLPTVYGSADPLYLLLQR